MKAEDEVLNKEVPEIKFPKTIISNIAELEKILRYDSINSEEELSFFVYLDFIKKDIQDIHISKTEKNTIIQEINNILKLFENRNSNPLNKDEINAKLEKTKHIISMYISTLLTNPQFLPLNTRIENLEEIYNNNLEPTLKVIRDYKEKFTIERDILLEQIKDEKKSFNQEISNDLKVIKETSETKSAEIITELNTKLEEAKNIVTTLGEASLTNIYSKLAEHHKTEADRFRKYTLNTMILCFPTIAIASIVSLFINIELTINQIISRFIIISVLTYPVIYLSKESSKHRALENKNRTLESQLSSLSAFLELLPNEEKNKLKQELASKYFTGASEDNKEEKNDTLVDQMEKLIKAFSPLINKEKDK